MPAKRVRGCRGYGLAGIVLLVAVATTSAGDHQGGCPTTPCEPPPCLLNKIRHCWCKCKEPRLCDWSCWGYYPTVWRPWPCHGPDLGPGHVSSEYSLPATQQTPPSNDKAPERPQDERLPDSPTTPSASSPYFPVRGPSLR
jgi:hypothetical protein